VLDSDLPAKQVHLNTHKPASIALVRQPTDTHGTAASNTLD